MTEHENSFPPEAVDEQIEQLPTVLSKEDFRLVHHLQRTYQTYAQTNAQSLERVWGRLVQDKGHAQGDHLTSAPFEIDNEQLGILPLENIKLHSRKPVKFLAAFNRVMLLVICTAILGTTVVTCSMIPSVQATDQQQESLIQDLLHNGATHIYSDYWTCDRLIFQSQERIICAVLDAGTFDRYAPYRAVVETDPRVAYVYPLHTIFIATAEKKLKASGIQYRQYIFDGYVVIFPQKVSAYKVFTATYTRQKLVNWIDFLQQVEEWMPKDVEWVYAVLDNLSLLRAMNVLFFNLAYLRWEFIFQPTAAAYLNLIEPWRKTLKSLAFKGQRFESWKQIEGRQRPTGMSKSTPMSGEDADGIALVASPALLDSPWRHDLPVCAIMRLADVSRS